jgi:ubiquinone/menaquinone biosynthesis C-methylase UbiE
LSVAREKSAEQGNDVLYLCQDAAKLDLYGTVDGAICCLDSLNHITDYDKFCEAVSRVSLFLEKDRLFIFDVNTVYKHKEVLGNNTFV